MEKTIYYHDTDAGGVVYYANYLKYLEEARTEFLNNRGISIKELHSEGFLYAVRKCSLTYKRPARYGDVIECKTEISKISVTQIFFNQNIYNKDTGALLVEAEMVLVSLNKEFQASPIPEDIKSRLS